MGVMFLVMTPCLYCNVSDSWMLPNKWKRMVIGAAGMYVEVALASICTFLWWFTHPGTLNYLCLNIMFISSVSTILFNANPLLRYDGYYILSDYLEIPNLRQKATTILRRKMGAVLLGLPEPEDPFLPQRKQALFAIYSVAAAIYRWVVSLSIFWFLYRVLEPYGFKLVGQMIAMMALYGLIVQPLWQLGKFFYTPGRIDQVNQKRFRMSLAAGAVGLLFFFCFPLPYSVKCSLYVQPRDGQPVYVETAGRLKQVAVRPGDRVQQGTTIAELRNADLQRRIAKLSGQKTQLESRWSSLLQRDLNGDKLAATELDGVRQSLAGVTEQLRKQQDQATKLTVTAPATGIVVRSASRPAEHQGHLTLTSWSGSIFDEANRGAALEESLSVCQIADPTKLEAVLAIDQNDLEFVHRGQSVEIVMAQLPWKRIRRHSIAHRPG